MEERQESNQQKKVYPKVIEMNRQRRNIISLTSK